MKGNPEPVKKLWSHREDASLANPQGSVARGWGEVAEAMDRAASTRRDGRFVGFETVAKRVTAELAYVVEVERLEAKVHGGQEITPYALRVTMIFRPEDGCVESGASARGSDNHPSAGRVGDPEVALPRANRRGRPTHEFPRSLSRRSSQNHLSEAV